MLWRDGPSLDAPILLVVVPPGETLRLHTRREAKNWAVPGSVCAWDGDRRRPTLKGSIVAPAHGWHGYVAAGELVTCADSPVR